MLSGINPGGARCPSDDKLGAEWPRPCLIFNSPRAAFLSRLPQPIGCKEAKAQKDPAIVFWPRCFVNCFYCQGRRCGIHPKERTCDHRLATTGHLGGPGGHGVLAWRQPRQAKCFAPRLSETSSGPPGAAQLPKMTDFCKTNMQKTYHGGKKYIACFPSSAHAHWP